MSAKAISEQTGKELLYKYICTTSAIQNRFKYARVTPDTDWARLLQDHPWLLSQVSLLFPRTPATTGPFVQAWGQRKIKDWFVGGVQAGHMIADCLHQWIACSGLSRGLCLALGPA